MPKVAINIRPDEAYTILNNFLRQVDKNWRLSIRREQTLIYIPDYFLKVCLCEFDRIHGPGAVVNLACDTWRLHGYDTMTGYENKLIAVTREFVIWQDPELKVEINLDNYATERIS